MKVNTFFFPKNDFRTINLTHTVFLACLKAFISTYAPFLCGRIYSAVVHPLPRHTTFFHILVLYFERIESLTYMRAYILRLGNDCAKTHTHHTLKFLRQMPINHHFHIFPREMMRRTRARAHTRATKLPLFGSSVYYTNISISLLMAINMLSPQLSVILALIYVLRRIPTRRR